MIIDFLFKKRAARIRFEKSLTDWQNIFYKSKANGADYDGDNLPSQRWDWPKNGFLTRWRERENATKKTRTED